MRRWRKELLDSGASPTSVAKAYRLLKAVLSTAVDDGIIRRNPCRIRGAGQDRSPERRTLTVRQVGQLATATRPRYRALVLLAVFGSLRWGELAALRRRDLDLERCTVKVERSLTELPGGGFSYGPPKSAAGARTVAFPDLIRADLGGTWPRSLPRMRMRWCSPARPVAHCGMATSAAGTGSRPWTAAG